MGSAGGFGSNIWRLMGCSVIDEVFVDTFVSFRGFHSGIRSVGSLSGFTGS